MSEKLKNNLATLMDEVRISAEELSRRTNVPASTIKKIRNKIDTNPTLSTLVPIAQYFSLSISQLIGDEALPESRVQGSYKPLTDTLHQIPLISWQEALVWQKEHIPVKSTVGTEYSYSKKAFALQIEEENLENLVKGTVLLIDPELQLAHRDYVVVHKMGQKKPALKLALVDNGEIYLKSLVQGNKMSSLKPEYRCLGIVVEYIKHLRENLNE